ncbi:UDP-glucuronosyltransferase 3A2-like [Arvicanthis niloticus]|uniref:UDP-glucuronosyltransferase 3A2-like n=1 Tax=Arvicanthis niloticus TaxID=61156 RepID=UPI00402BCB86
MGLWLAHFYFGSVQDCSLVIIEFTTNNHRFGHQTIVKVYRNFGNLCSHLLSKKNIMEFLQNENFDLVLLNSLDFCSLLVVEKLGKRFVSFYPGQFSFMDVGLPSPLSYVPVYGSGLTDQMDFWGRVKNFLMFFDFSMKQREILSQYDSTIQEHFAEGPRPVLSDLLLKAELWFVNSDFALDFARPLFPNTVYVGGLLDKPVQPIPQVSDTVALNLYFIQRPSVVVGVVNLAEMS